MEVVDDITECIESVDSTKEPVSEANTLKEKGNAAFKDKDFETAISFFTQAIEIDASNHIYYTNRCLCYSSLALWGKSAQDASIAVKLAPKNPKANFLLIKALFELSRFKEARLYLANALRDCGEVKVLRSLEEELFVRTGIALRPKSTDFEIVEELGDGNFSKVFKAAHKKTNKVYAIKTIERQTIDRMKRRHGNINNEILMEKRALHKLDHPGIVTLYCTFQDYGTLYYQMEFIGGKDLWSLLQENLDSNQAQVGCHWTLARFYMAEAINALEHMHRKGIVHRDVKPENMIIGVDGHLKFIDYGTAKDLFQPDLNGPDFVGTSEYMSPATINNKPGGVEIDLWALGVVLFQMILGYTPFGAASPYLIFLRIKRAFLRIPGWVPNQISSMIRMLIEKDIDTRLNNATGQVKKYENLPTDLQDINYDALRSQPFFTEWNALYSQEDITAITALGVTLPEHLFQLTNNDTPSLPSENGADLLHTLEGIRSVYERVAVVGAPHHEVLIRVVGRAALELAEATSNNGGVKPDTEWMQTFDLQKLTFIQRQQIAHYLNRRQRLHSPPVFRLFCANAIDARALRADPLTNEYVGFSRQIQGQWNKDFVYVHLSNPHYSTSASPPADVGATTNNGQSLRDSIAAINKLRPKFVVVSGNLTELKVSDEGYSQVVEEYRRTMARLSDTIPVMYVPGEHDVGHTPTSATLAAYRSKFGADYYGVWYGGVRYLMINSCLMIHSDAAKEEASLQDIWFWEEIEQCKLCSCSIVVFSYHTWFHEHIDEADDNNTTFPKELRYKWLKKLRHHKVKLSVSSHFDSKNDRIITPGKKGLRPFVVNLNELAIKRAAEEAEAEAEEEKRIERLKAANIKGNNGSNYKISYSDGEEPPKPSEVIRDAVESGELSQADVNDAIPMETEVIGVSVEDVTVAVDIAPVVDPTTAAPVDDSSDDENDYEKEGTTKDDNKEEDFSNEEEDYEGPQLIQTSPIQVDGNVRFILAQEEGVQQAVLTVSAIPKTMNELMTLFK